MPPPLSRAVIPARRLGMRADLERPPGVEVLASGDAKPLQGRLHVRPSSNLEGSEQRLSSSSVDSRPPSVFPVLQPRVDVPLFSNAFSPNWGLAVINMQPVETAHNYTFLLRILKDIRISLTSTNPLLAESHGTAATDGLM